MAVKKNKLVRKTRKDVWANRIINELKNGYGLTERELTSGSVMYADARVTPEEIAPQLFRNYGVSTSKQEFSSWGEFVGCLADAIIASGN